MRNINTNYVALCFSNCFSGGFRAGSTNICVNSFGLYG